MIEPPLHLAWSSKVIAIGGMLVQGMTEKEIINALGLGQRGAQRAINRLKRDMRARNVHHLTALLARLPMYEDVSHMDDPSQAIGATTGYTDGTAA